MHQNMHGYAKESSSEYLNPPPASETVGTGAAATSSGGQFSDFLEIPETLFARQLTRMDCVSNFQTLHTNQFSL